MTTADALLRRVLRYFHKTDCTNALAEDIENYLEAHKDEPNTQSLYPDPELTTKLSLQDMCRGDK